MTSIKHIESSVKIYFTRDHKAFNYLKGNRDLNMNKVRRIVKEIKAGNNVLRYAPIMVNQNMEIIDGQHRHAAAELTGENVYYVINQEATLSLAPKINSNSSNWTGVDYLRSYSDINLPAYIVLKNFMKIYDGISIPVAGCLLHGGNSQVSSFKEILSSGGLEINFEERAHLIAGLLSDFVPFCATPYSRRMAHVMCLLHDNGKYDHDLMLQKLKLSGEKIITMESPKVVMQQMESIINYKAKNRILIH